MGTINLLYRREFPINEHIRVVIPTVREIIENEDEYYSLVNILTAMPIDLMVQLDDMGIDYTELNEYQLFLIMFAGLRNQDTKLIFGDLDLTRFSLEVNENNGMPILRDRTNGVVIDRAIHGKITEVLRRIHHLKKNVRKPANDEAKSYMMQRARDKMKRHKNRVYESQIEPLIVAMVNTEQFKYGYGETLDLTIYQFNESVRQIITKVDYEHIMHGVYAGTVDYKSIQPDKLNWLTHNN